MKVKTFFALIAAKQEKATENLRNQYQKIITDPEGNAILQNGIKTDIVAYLDSKHINLSEDQLRRMRALSLLQLSQEEVFLSLEASKGDDNEQNDKIETFRSNIRPFS
jgi:hypothetical protein